MKKLGCASCKGNVATLEALAKDRLASLNITRLHLYVTGLTVALIACLNATRELGIEVILWHFDRESGKYYSQEVKQYEDILKKHNNYVKMQSLIGWR